MDTASGLEPDHRPDLTEFLLARIAADERAAAEAVPGAGSGDPARARAECAAKRRLVLVCRESRPERSFLGARPPGMPDFPLTPRDQHQLAALVLGLLALPYAGHPDYRDEWRP